MLLNETAGIDLRVVHLVRDSRGVVYSWQKKRVKPEVYWKTEYMDRVNPFSAAWLWNFTNLLMQSLQKVKGGYLFVRYEELIDSPRLWLSKILDFAGGGPEKEAGLLEPLTEKLLSAGDNTNQVTDHTAGGNPSRYHHGAITLRPDNEWRQKMSATQKRLVTTLTAPLLHKYGYSTSWDYLELNNATVESRAALAENERSMV